MRSVAVERRRAEDADRRLGHALLECGRVRAALAAANGAAGAAEEGYLDATGAEERIRAVRRPSSGPHLPQEHR